MKLTSEIALAHRLADAAREEIRPLFRSLMDSEAKDDASPVTIADRNAEQAMRALIEAAFPADGIHGEEFGVQPGTSGRQWVLDPIDGTTAFLAGRPIFGTLIALLVEGFPVLGMIDQPQSRGQGIASASQRREAAGTRLSGHMRLHCAPQPSVCRVHQGQAGRDRRRGRQAGAGAQQCKQDTNQKGADRGHFRLRQQQQGECRV